jgi:hypothetical protein
VFLGGAFSGVVITDPGLMDCATNLAFPVVDGSGANSCPETAVSMTTDPDYAEYQWYRDGAAIPRATTSVHDATLSGEYRVRIGDGSGCLRDSLEETVLVSFCPETEIAPDGALFPLRIAKDAASPTGAYVTFQAVDGVDGFHLYEGDLGSWYSHGGAPGNTCAIEECIVPNEPGCFDDLGTGEVRTAVSLGSGDHYYLVSGYQGSTEGPTGADPAQSTCP